MNSTSKIIQDSVLAVRGILLKPEPDLVSPLLKALQLIPTMMPIKAKLPETSALTMLQPTGLFSVPHIYRLLSCLQASVLAIPSAAPGLTHSHFKWSP